MPVLRTIQKAAVAASAIAALLFPATLAAADTARSELSVGATVVVPTCIVSTDVRASAPALSCTRGTQPSITTERRVERAIAGENRKTAESTASAAVTLVTISY